MEFTCEKCGEDFETESFPYGDDVTCPHCGTVWHTDWECGWDNRSAWITDPAEAS